MARCACNEFSLHTQPRKCPYNNAARAILSHLVTISESAPMITFTVCLVANVNRTITTSSEQYRMIRGNVDDWRMSKGTAGPARLSPSCCPSSSAYAVALLVDPCSSLRMDTWPSFQQASGSGRSIIGFRPHSSSHLRYQILRSN